MFIYIYADCTEDFRRFVGTVLTHNFHTGETLALHSVCIKDSDLWKYYAQF